MKCTQCENTQFYQPQDSGFGFYSGEVSFHSAKNRKPIANICTKCGHIEWFDLGPIEKAKEINEAISKIKNEILLQEKELFPLQEKLNRFNSDIEKLNSFIKDVNNTVKAINDATLQVSKINEEVHKFYKETKYRQINYSIAENKKKLFLVEQELKDFNSIFFK